MRPESWAGGESGGSGDPAHPGSSLDPARTGGGSGVLLLRAWLHDGTVVARVRWSSSTGAAQRAEVVVGTEQVVHVVREWLRTIGEADRV